jgi:hypothetical protein
MSRAERLAKAEQTIEDFLGVHRHDPPQREGWYAGHEIYQGIFDEIGKRLNSARMFKALNIMLQTIPPKVEDTWMWQDEHGLPIVDESDPTEIPDRARRYYRMLQPSDIVVTPDE